MNWKMRESSYDLEKAAKLQHGTIPTLEKELQDLEKSDRPDEWLVEESVTENEIAAVVSREERAFRLLN